MSVDTLINKVSSDLLDVIRKDILTTWMAHHAGKISEEVEELIVKREKENAAIATEKAEQKYEMAMDIYKNQMGVYQEKFTQYEGAFKAYTTENARYERELQQYNSDMKQYQTELQQFTTDNVKYGRKLQEYHVKEKERRSEPKQDKRGLTAFYNWRDTELEPPVKPTRPIEPTPPRHKPIMPTEPAKPPKPSKPEYTTSKRGIKYPKGYCIELNGIEIEGIKQVVTQKYQDLFINTRWEESAKNSIKAAIKQQIATYKPEWMMQNFFDKHPWLYGETLRDHDVKRDVNEVTYTFLYDVLSHQLQTALESGPLTEWTAIEVPFLLGQKPLKWQSMDGEWLQHVTDIFPYSDLSKFYIQGACSSHAHLFSIMWLHYSKRKEQNDWHNLPLNRVDLFRIIYSIYNRAGNFDAIESSTLSSELVSSKVAPLHGPEFMQLRAEELNHFDTLLVNFSPEGHQGLWLVLDKSEEKQWTVYAPSTIQQIDLNILERTLKRNASTLKIQLIDFSTNQSLNDLTDLGAVAEWNSVALGRVLPWCANKQLQHTTSLLAYRQHVPITLLLQEVFEHSLGIPHADDVKAKLLGDFNHRQPFTKCFISEEKPSIGNDSQYLLGRNAQEFSNALNNASVTSKLFDDGIFNIDEPQSALTIEHKDTSSFQILSALNIIYHHPSLSYFSFPPLQNKLQGSIAELLFNYDIHIKTLKPQADVKQHLSSYAYPLHCAARNRFLEEVDNDYLVSVQDNIQRRRQLWVATGEKLVDFFNNEGQEISLDVMNQIREFNVSWVSNNCDHEDKSGTTPTVWAFAQIAQMGVDGLNAMFNYLKSGYKDRWKPIDKEPSPALSYVGDLSSSMTTTAKEYFAALTAKINGFSVGPHGCAPLFKSVAVILPEVFDNSDLIALIDALNYRKNRFYQDEVGEIALHNIAINSPQATDLLDKLQLKAEQGDLQIVPRLLEWDRDTYDNPSLRAEKARYRLIQNIVLNNQRKRQQAVLVSNTSSIAACKVLVEDNVASQAQKNQALSQQSWDGDDVIYPLSTQVPGVQQQLQQQVEQQVVFEVKQQVEVEEEYEHEQEQQVVEYGGNEDDLITRGNINERGKDAWALIDEELKQYSGVGEDDLSQLFTVWVGSHLNASNVIEKIEFEAMKKMMHYASQFRLGISKDNLPPGFRLQHSKLNRGLILCYSDKWEKEDLRKRVALKEEEKHNPQTKNRCNPFTVELHDPLTTREFLGDFRQKITFDESSDVQQTLWQYLATEDKDEIRIQNASSLLERVSSQLFDESHASVMVQRFDAFKKIKNPGAYQKCLESLAIWASKQNVSDELIEVLFGENAVLTEKNLKALGQLFYHYDTQTAKATQHWLVIANLIHTTFGQENFLIWKNRLLEASVNWVEILEQKEVEAITESIETLKDDEQAQAIWWQLVDAHGKATGHMQYSQLWAGFKMVYKYLDKHELAFHSESMKSFLKHATDFNGQVFLDRLYRTLKTASKRLDAKRIQQNILDNIKNIDWRHSGFYYASRYENITNWHENLVLSEFTPSYAASEPGYAAPWPDNITLNHISIHALRFADQHLRLTQEEFNHLSDVLTALDLSSTPSNNAIARLLMVCLTSGMNQVSKLNVEHFKDVHRQFSKTDPTFLAWLNSQFLLDGTEKQTLHLRFEDMPILAQVLTDLDLLEEVKNLSSVQAIEFINACGRALQWRRENRTDTLGLLLRFATEYQSETGTFLHPLLTVYPWLLDDAAKRGYQEWNKIDHILCINNYGGDEVEKFEEQLHSIDFDSSTWLPDRVNLTDAFQQINASEQPEVRVAEVDALIKKGCFITNQDGAGFRPLTQDEKTFAYGLLERNLKGSFKDINLSLFTKLIEQSLAVKERAGDGRQELTDLVDFLVTLDNKFHYNELGPVIGTLLDKARIPGTDQWRRFSLTQLTTWLTTIHLPLAQAKAYHYGVNVLTELLDNKDVTLLSDNLSELRENIRSKGLLEQVKAISHADLPNQYKPALVKMATHDLSFVKTAQGILVHCHQAKVSAEWLSSLAQLLTSLSASSGNDRSKRRAILPLSEQLDNIHGINASESFKKLWQQIQIKLINQFIKGDISSDIILETLAITDAKSAYIKAILAEAVTDWPRQMDTVLELRALLSQWSSNELHKLAEYYALDPHPSLELLNQLVKFGENHEANVLIHHFESVHQGLDDKGLPKRHYSLTELDRTSLHRVLKGFKRKGRGFIQDSEVKKLINLFEYTNNYSQAAALATLPIEHLRDLLNQAIQESNALGRDVFSKNQASARALACMREILLRKSGKWANHTQMLDLLYAALYNDESMLHQARTGQGKSIITIMRAGYLALNGYVVDVFSAKDSLSFRDHEEFASVLDGMGIPHNYIPATGDATIYKTNPSGVGVGAVNYATMGNFSLYHSGHIWLGKDKIDLTIDKRVAFIDEADHVLTDEQTQFNHSDNRENDAIYNLDEWVYRVAYDYYQKNKDKFIKNELGIPTVSRQKELKELCELIQQHSICSPKESRFMGKYIIPALSEIPDEMDKRDQQLRQLLTAAHIAHGLKENSSFCVRSSTQVVCNGMLIQTRFAKVMIDNQVKDGSTYSDLVQQFLHVRLNVEAATRGETPNFFVEPNSQIALSQNAKYLLKKYYHKLEGCTGTAGNIADLKEYEAIYDIKHVIKLPSHEPLRTKFLPPVYADSADDQVEAIVAAILRNDAKADARAVLITCEDDIAVERLAAKIQARLKARDYDLNKFYVDTNKKGKPESEIVPHAGRIGRVTISSRLGRGTDIKPDSRKGLSVIRTYPTTPRVSKQERGRQGRNGALGLCQDIINYQAVKEDFEYYQAHYGERFAAIYKEQGAHLEQKLDKNRANGSKKWQWTDNLELKQRYLITRSVQELKHELKAEHESFLRQKEYLIASLSGDVMDLLHNHIGDHLEARHSAELKEHWLELRKKIEALWSARLAGEKTDTQAIYDKFFLQANALWQEFCQCYPLLNNVVLVELAGHDANVDGTVQGFIQKQQDKWQEKIANERWKPSSREQKELKAARNELRKLLVKYHPDKIGDAHVEISKQLTALNTLINGGLQRAGVQVHQEGNGVQPVENDGAPIEVNIDPSRYNSIVPYIKPVEHELETVIAFYQQWIKGTEKYYFGENPLSAELRTAILGVGFKQLNSLFHDVYQVSYFNPEHPHLNEQEQLSRREFIFDNFIRMFNYYPGAFSLSCQGLSNLMGLLMSQPRPVYENDYILSIVTVFEQDWLKHKRPDEHQPADIKKHDMLLQMVLKIVMTAFVNDNEATITLIKNLCSLIHERYWNIFDESFVEELLSLFAHEMAITTLLTERVNNKVDLGNLINLLMDNRNAAHGERNKDNLLGYLREKGAILDKKPAILRPLFGLALSVANRQDKENHLPDNVDILDRRPAEVSSQDLWFFLTQRGPNSQKDVDDLMSRISVCEDDDVAKKVFEPLLALPPHLPLQLINEDLVFEPGHYYQSSARAKLKTLHAFGKVFNEFLFNRGLIHSKEQFSLVVDTVMTATSWIERCGRGAVAENHRFYKLAKNKAYAVIPNLYLTRIYDTYIDGNLPKNELVIAFDVAKKLHENNKIFGQNPDFYFEKFCRVITDREGLHAFDTFVNVVNQQCQLVDFPPDVVSALSGAYLVGYIDKQKLLMVFELVQKATQFNYIPGATLYDVIKDDLVQKLENSHDFSVIGRYATWIDALTQEKESFKAYSNLVGDLRRAFIFEKTIQDKAELDKCLSVIKRASALNLYVLMGADFIKALNSRAVIQSFEKMDIFLSSVETSNLDHETIMLLYTSFSNRRITNKALEQAVEISHTISHLGLNGALNQAVHDAIRSREADNAIGNLGLFVNSLVETQKHYQLNNDIVASLYTAFNTQRMKNTANVHTAIMIFHEMARLGLGDRRDNALIRALQAANADDAIERLRKFIVWVSDVNNQIGLEQRDRKNAISSIFTAYQERLISPSDLNDTASVLKTAIQLKEHQNYTDYFYGFNSNQAKRKKLMQYLNQDVIELGRSFKERCFEEYNALAKRIFSKPVYKAGEDRPKSLTRWRMAYQNMIAFTNELVAITQPIAAGDVLHRHGREALGEKAAVYSAYFTAQQSRYNSIWVWKNSDRKAQANRLFTNLNSSFVEDNKENWYCNAFTHIYNAQKEILESDRHTSRNKKGHSRLYDITMQMFLTLAKDCLQDDKIALTEKQRLSEELRRQLTLNIKTLKERAESEDSQLYQHIDEAFPGGEDQWRLHSGSPAFVALRNKLHSLPVVKELRYLVDNLSCLMEISYRNESNQLALSNRAGFGG